MKDKIEWTEESWNPVSGCRNDCYYCYARAIYKRFGWDFSPRFHEKRLKKPLSFKKPTMFFVCSVADLFGDWVPKEWIEEVFKIIKKCPDHMFQFLTKNPNRLIEFSPYPNNCWIGCSATNEAMAENALEVMPRLEAKIKFLSCEPLLDKINIDFAGRINWLIIGACTGKYKKQPKADWTRGLIKSAIKENIPIFIKPNLFWEKQIMEMPDSTGSYQKSLF